MNDRGAHLEPLWPTVNDAFLKHHLPGTSASMTHLRNAVAGLNSSFNRDLVTVILLTGETGAGKNHVAAVIAGHRNWLDGGARLEVSASLESYTGRFGEISLPTLPDTLAESELFGHRKGAFTGADREKDGLLAGKFDEILLDEIGDASTALQAKLLGVMQSRRFRKVGAQLDQQERTDARFILATHRDLQSLVRQGAFREDLYWRAMECPLRVPPLRDQTDNIQAAIRYQLERLLPLGMYSVGGLRQPPSLTESDLQWASSYDWPGNFRQLRHALVRWLAMGGELPLRTVALDVVSAPQAYSGAVSTARSGGSVNEILDAARATGNAAATTLGDFVERFRRDIENEIVAWYDQHKPSAEVLDQLFPGMKSSSAISKLSQWRTR